MVVNHFEKVESKKVESPLAKDAYMKVLVSEKEGWDSHVMRVVEVEGFGYTPKHQHPWPHINYVIQGKGNLMINGEDHPLEAGIYAFVPDNALHQFQNKGEETLKFICIVPKKGHQ